MTRTLCSLLVRLICLPAGLFLPSYCTKLQWSQLQAFLRAHYLRCFLLMCFWLRSVDSNPGTTHWALAATLQGGEKLTDCHSFSSSVVVEYSIFTGWNSHGVNHGTDNHTFSRISYCVWQEKVWLYVSRFTPPWVAPKTIEYPHKTTGISTQLRQDASYKTCGKLW